MVDILQGMVVTKFEVLFVQFHYVLIFICVSELPESVPMSNVTASGSSEVGQSFNLSCSVTLLERMVVSPGIDYNITWTKMDNVSEGVIGKDINITTMTTISDPITTIKLIFDPLEFGDRGKYICNVEFNVTTTQDVGTGSDEVDVIVDCKLDYIIGRYTPTKMLDWLKLWRNVLVDCLSCFKLISVFIIIHVLWLYMYAAITDKLF